MSDLAKDIIAAYKAHGRYTDTGRGAVYPLDRLKDPKLAYCMCEDISRDFWGFIQKNYPGVCADLWKDKDPKLFGFEENLDLPHTVLRIFENSEDKEHFHTVDWTSSQYQNDEFPCVREFTSSEALAQAAS